jgi:hypothetical protein
MTNPPYLDLCTPHLSTSLICPYITPPLPLSSSTNLQKLHKSPMLFFRGKSTDLSCESISKTQSTPTSGMDSSLLIFDNRLGADTNMICREIDLGSGLSRGTRTWILFKSSNQRSVLSLLAIVSSYHEKSYEMATWSPCDNAQKIDTIDWWQVGISGVCPRFRRSTPNVGLGWSGVALGILAAEFGY